MDDFLRDIYIEVFKQWIYHHKNDDLHMTMNNHMIVIDTEYSHSEVNFHDKAIIELSVTNTVKDSMEFYLHFQMKTIHHAIELFDEMLECIQKLVNKPMTNILLSCTSGLTTGFFAETLNEAAQMLSLDYQFDAVPYNDLFENVQQYDMILLAPQISYMQAKVQDVYKNQKVLKIPAQIFAKYDVNSMLSMINDELQLAYQKEKMIIQVPSLKQIYNHDNRILCMAMIRIENHYRFAYRIYDKNNQIILDKEVIKNHIDLEDIYDILDVVLTLYSHIDIVGIAMPGIINEGHVTLRIEGYDNCDLIYHLTKRYPQKFILSNDVNCVAVGYYVTQDEYESLSFLMQSHPSSRGGVGSIYNGQLIEGRMSIAGEVKHLPLVMDDQQRRTPQGAIQYTASILVCIISVLGPEAIILFTPFICDTQDLIKEMTKFIPVEYIPPLIPVKDLKEYILLGQMIKCIQSYHKNEI